MNRSPRFFSVRASSRLDLETVFEQKVDHAGYVSQYGPGPITIGCDGSNVWTPTISNHNGILIVQRPLAQSMIDSALKGLSEMYPVNIRPDWPAPIHRKRWAEAPEYVWFRLRRDIALEPAYLEWPDTESIQSSGCAYRTVPVPQSHGGAEVFGVRGLPWTSLYCTRRFVESARANRWKDFRFGVMDLPHPDTLTHHIDYLGKTWPPKRWYPDGIEGHSSNLEDWL
jgi:hypothetical protein